MKNKAAKITAKYAIAFVWLPSSSSPAAQENGPILARSIPSDSVAVFFVTPQRRDAAPAAGEPSLSGLVTTLLEQARTMGLLAGTDPCTRAWLDSFTVAVELARFPHALVLLDIDASRRQDGGHQLSRLAAAVVVETGGEHALLERRIQHLLNAYANNQETILSNETTSDGTRSVIRDRRLPQWAAIHWGSIGNLYVAAIGVGAFEQIAAAVKDPSKSLPADEWFANASRDVQADGAAAALFLNPERLTRRVDARLGEKIRGVQSALGLERVSHALWSLGRAGRAVEIRSALRRAHRDESEILAGSRFRGVARETWVPEQAEWFTILDISPRSALRGVSEAYSAAKSSSGQERAREFWSTVQSHSGVIIEQDIIAPLGPAIVIHDYPPHAFHLPLAWTVQFQIDGDVRRLRSSVDRLLEYARSELVKQPGVQLAREEDGIWYTSYGLAGPALAIKDRWLMVSFSPHAVRQAVEALDRQSASAEKASGR